MNDTPQLNEHNKEEYPPMHTTEHIVNQTMVRLFGCGRAVSAHIEKKKSKLDFKLPQPPSDDEIRQVEETVSTWDGCRRMPPTRCAWSRSATMTNASASGGMSRTPPR